MFLCINLLHCFSHPLPLDDAYICHCHTLRTRTNMCMWVQMNYQNKHLVGAMIVAGWDATLGGQVYGCPIGGTIVRENWTTDGSGSTFIWGLLESEYKEGMEQKEAEELVCSALALAMARDASSGGVIRIATINESGTERKMITPDEHPDILWDEIASQPVGIRI